MSRIYLLLIATSILLLICTSLLSTSGLSPSTNSGSSSQLKLQYPPGGESYVSIELPWTGKLAVSMLSAMNNIIQDHGILENDESSSRYNLSGQWKVNLT